MDIKIIIDDKNIKTLTYDSPVLLSRVIRDSGCGFSFPCSGKGVCGKCRVRVTGCVSEADEREKKLTGENSAFRLACLTKATGDCELFLPDKNITALTDGLCSRYSHSPFGEGVGAAVDIGTTTVALYLYELENEKLLSVHSFANPQGIYGADVISRIEASLGEEKEKLRALISKGLEEGIAELCDKANINKEECKTAVVTGNTAMLSILLGEDVTGLSASPFTLADYFGKTVNINGMRTYIPRAISPFVGSDITCALISGSDIMKNEKLSLLVDIGTNGEMAIKKGEEIICCSCAAGPAFEGTGIRMGAPAREGAINRVWQERGEIKYSVIGDKTADGICGSALIDSLALFLSLGMIDETGLIKNPTEFEGQPAIQIADSGVYITQKDIRSAQLAKAAIRAGIDSLLNSCGAASEDLGRLILAGGFGSFISPENAEIIGLIPPGTAKRTVAVGNAAGMGASAILLSRQALEKSEITAKNAASFELATSDFFMKSYIDNMYFTKKD